MIQVDSLRHSFLPYFVMANIIADLLGGCRDMNIYFTTLSHKATFAVLGNIRKRVCEKMIRVPLGTVLDMPSGSIKNVLVERIDSIETAMAHIISKFTSNLLVPIALLVYLFALDSAGSYSAMLRSIDLSVSKAQSVLDMPTMDIDGKNIMPASYDIDVDNVEFFYDKRRIIDSVSVHIPQKTTTIVGPSGGGLVCFLRYRQSMSERRFF